MAELCKYSGALGTPGKGIHSPRIGGLAAADLLLTAGLAYLISWGGLGHPELLMFVIVFIILIIVAIAVHEAFCVNTRLNAAVFGRPWGPTPARAP